jgi:hypothetical protein
LDVPSNYHVGASGERVSDVTAGARRKLRYVAEPVHDFAWTAWDGFVEQRTRIEGTDVTLLTPGNRAPSARATEAALRSALPEFSRRYGTYPYRTLTVVHPPESAAAAGGMEYPTLITTGGAWYLPHTGVRALESLTLHELAHQWFYGLVATNEARYPFLDEGLTTFAELSALKSRYGDASLANLLGLEISAEAGFRALAALRPEDEPIASAASAFTSFDNLGLLVYLRTATLLETLARVFGRTSLDQALGSYARKYRWRHPGPAELIAELREHVGSRAADVFERAVFARGRVNYLVREIRSARSEVAAGVFDRAGGRVMVRQTSSETPRYRSLVTIYREGDLELPVDVLLITSGGSRRLERWDGVGFTHSFVHEGDEPLVQAVVDPQHRLLIEDDLFDNSVAVRSAPVFRVHERLAYFGALALGGLTP